jgi:hypothetical protein
MRNTRLLIALTATAALAACGARSSLIESTSTTSSASSSSGAGANGACSTWSRASEPPIALTDASVNSELTAVLAEASRVFIATNNIDAPTSDPTWRVRVVSDDLTTLGSPTPVMSWPSNLNRSGLRLASGFGHRGAMAWDESQLCRFISIADDGSPSNVPTTIAPDWCYWLSATQKGFTAFISPNEHLLPLDEVIVDANGNLVDKHATLPNNGDPSSYPLAHLDFADGTSLILFRTKNAVMRVHLDAAGTTLYQSTPLYFAEPLALAAVSLGDRALIAWTPTEPAGELWVGTMSEDGEIGAAQSVATGAANINDVALAVAGPGALLAWSAIAPELSGIQVQPLTRDGQPSGAPLMIPTAVSNRVQLVGTPRGALVVFDDKAPQQVFATPLLCQ